MFEDDAAIESGARKDHTVKCDGEKAVGGEKRPMTDTLEPGIVAEWRWCHDGGGKLLVGWGLRSAVS